MHFQNGIQEKKRISNYRPLTILDFQFFQRIFNKMQFIPIRKTDHKVYTRIINFVSVHSGWDILLGKLLAHF